MVERFGVSYSAIGKSSIAYRWKERALAWDDEQHRAASKAKLEAVGDIGRESAAQWEMIGAKALAAFKMMKSDELSPRDALAMLDKATHYRRLAIGEATDIVQTKESIDLSRLTTEEVHQFRRLLKKARGEG